jgi:hypothetical protein
VGIETAEGEGLSPIDVFFFLNVTATGLPDFTGLVVCVACFTIFQLCLLG